MEDVLNVYTRPYDPNHPFVRREVNEGLNVVERWNGVNDFILGREYQWNRKPG
jgi:hypothetical protein